MYGCSSHVPAAAAYAIETKCGYASVGMNGQAAGSSGVGVESRLIPDEHNESMASGQIVITADHALHAVKIIRTSRFLQTADSNLN